MQPLPACSVGSYTDGQVVQYTADRARRGWVSQMFVYSLLQRLEIREKLCKYLSESWGFNFKKLCFWNSQNQTGIKIFLQFEKPA